MIAQSSAWRSVLDMSVSKAKARDRNSMKSVLLMPNLWEIT